MLWCGEDLWRIEKLLNNKKGTSVKGIAKKLGYKYSEDDISGVCGAMLMSGKDEEMSAEKIDTAEFWQLVDEKKSAKEIADRFGVSVLTVYKKITKGRPKAEAVAVPENNEGGEDMKKFDWTPERLEKLLEMGEDAYSPQKIAETLGCDAKTVSNKLYGLKIANGGKIPPSRKRRYTVADVTPYKPEDEEADGVDMPTETVNETTETVNETTESVIEETETVIEETETQFETAAKSEPETQRDAPKAETHMETVDTSKRCHSMQNPIVNEPPRPDILALANKAKFLADDAGLKPVHVCLDIYDAYSDVIVSGEDHTGKIYEIRYSVTDLAKLSETV